MSNIASLCRNGKFKDSLLKLTYYFVCGITHNGGTSETCEPDSHPASVYVGCNLLNFISVAVMNRNSVSDLLVMQYVPYEHYTGDLHITYVFTNQSGASQELY